jgi:predicted dehydrogenase
MANEKIKIGIIGLDTSHVTAFTELLNNEENPYHVTGCIVVVAYPGGSPDFELSYSRVAGFTEKLRDRGVQIVQSPEEVAELSDAILLESVDGRVHLDLFKRVVPYRKPVFIDKPFTLSMREAQEIKDLANEYSVPVMSSSSLRYAEGFTQAITNSEKGDIFGVDCYGPMGMQETQPGLFWYGIHTVEMLFTVLGDQCSQVMVTTTEDHDLIVGTWADGRIGTIRGNRKDNYSFGAVLHRDNGSQFVDVDASAKPKYAGLLEKIIAMFTGATPDVPLEETKQIIRFIEAANESRLTGQIVLL